MALHEPSDFTAFLASSVHDMKNSMQLLTSALEGMVAETGARERRRQERLGQLLYEAKRVNGNLLRLLSIYKMGQSAYPVDISQHRVDEFLQEVLIQCRPLMGQRGLSLTCETPGAVSWCFDRELVAGILGNAVHNAARYCREQIWIRAGIRDGWLEIQVADDGEGYPDSLLAAGGFSQGVGEGGGGCTGLGLYFSAMAAGMHRNRGLVGGIELHNRPEGGGDFRVRLP